ncbi:hypothetical protein LUZ60_008968 [Juncus effusus]|nr:hypothetical protein LUZ60_008968 [Juncus effusus]
MAIRAYVGLALHPERMFLTGRPASTSLLSTRHSTPVYRNCVVQARNPRALEDKRLQKSAKSKRKRLSLRRGKVSEPLLVPDEILRPPYVITKELPGISPDIQIHDYEGLLRMKAACQLAARVLEHAGTLVKPGVTTDEIDKAVHEMIIKSGAYPSPLNYGGFPKSVCTSVNECVCHGIPDSRPLKDGDIINIDVTVYLDGYHGDTSKTFFCGDVDEDSQQLVKVTEECLMEAISICKDGASYQRIGSTINKIAEKNGYNIVETFVGHGVGKIFHSEPLIIHTRNNRPGKMVEGQTFTIEPILTTGTNRYVMWDDSWTALTADGSLAAQFEHTILITKSGAEILTIC